MEGHNFFAFDTVISSVAYYIIAAFSFLLACTLSPTNLAGPGFDIVVFLFVIIFSIYLLFKNWRLIKKGKSSWAFI